MYLSSISILGKIWSYLTILAQVRVTITVQVTKLYHASTAEGYLTNVAQVSPALPAPELFVSEGLILSERKCIRAML